MPASGPVYQPTTVSYETRPGLLSQTTSVSPLKVFKKPIPQISLLICSLLLIAAGKLNTPPVLLKKYNYFFFLIVFVGIAMIVNGAADYEDTEKHQLELGLSETTESIDIGVVVGGVLMTIIGFICLGLYIKVAEWRRSYVCPCGLSKKQGLARQLQGQNGGQIMALNPSTDPLVTHTQYAPVSELPRPEDEECRTLMLDNKEW